MRALVLCLCLGLAGCSALDPFDTDRGSYSATVRGAEALDLRGSGFYSQVSDDPPAWSIYLTGTNAPVVRFEIEAAAVEARTYAVPTDVQATFEINRLAGPVYAGTGGALVITSATGARAEGTFAFTASGPDGEVTVEGRFVAE